jgi:hypothetical protein
MMRMFLSTVSLTRRAPPSPSVGSRVWVRIRSMRSPGKIRPELAEVGVIGTETARMPGSSTAARKPRSPGLTTAPSVIGSPMPIPRRTTAPIISSWLRTPLST